MKLMRVPYFLFIIVSAILLQTTGATEEDEVPDRVGTIVENEDDRLEKISEIEEVRVLIEAVRTGRGQNLTPDDLEYQKPLNESEWQNVWNDISQNNPDLKEQIYEILNGKSTNEKGETVVNDINYNYDLGNFDKKQSESLKKLQSFYKDRLAKKLFGEDSSETNGLKAVVDHNLFHRLYKSQIGKNLTVELSNYCIHSDPISGLVPFKNDDKDKAAALRNQNLKTLSQYGASGTETQDGGKQRGFEKCLARVADSCDNKQEYLSHKVQKPDGQQEENPFPSIGSNPDETGKEQIRVPQPCEISRYMTAVKITLKELEELREEKLALNANTDDNNVLALNIKNKEVLNTDSVVNISSGEILNGEGNEFKDQAQEEAHTAQECIVQGGTTCGDSYTVSKEESSSIQDEFNFRNIAMQNKLVDEVLTQDAEPEDMVNFLLKKGMNEGSIQRLYDKIKAIPGNENLPDVEIYSIIIKDRFENERIALQESLKNRLKEREKPDETNQREMDSRAEEIKASIEDAPTQLAQVFQYANVVSSFLVVEGEDGSVSTNSAALVAELDDPFNSEVDPRSPNSVAQDLTALEDFANEGDDNEGGPSNGAELSSKEIDTIQFGIGKEENQQQ